MKINMQGKAVGVVLSGVLAVSMMPAAAALASEATVQYYGQGSAIEQNTGLDFQADPWATATDKDRCIAKKTVCCWANTDKDAVNALANLSDDEKAYFCDEINHAVNGAFSGIDDAIFVFGVVNAQNDGIYAMGNALGAAMAQDAANLADEKAAMTEAVDDTVELFDLNLDALANLTEEQAQAAKDQATEAAEAVKAEMAEATTIEDVDALYDTFLNETLQAIYDEAAAQDAENLAAAQADAKAAVDAAADDALAAIDELTNLDEGDAETFKAAITGAQEEADGTIEDVDTIADVEAAEADGLLGISQTVAKAQIADQVAVDEAAIDELTNLTDTDKAAYKQQIEDAEAAAAEAIATCEDPEAVEAAKAQALEDIQAIVDKASAQKVYIDVPLTGTWYSDPVYAATRMGIVKGYEGGDMFGPNDNMTRAQLAVVIWRYYGSPEPAGTVTLPDIEEGQYYTEAAKWAVEQHIITGFELTDGTFMFYPDALTDREQTCTILARAAHEFTGAVVEGSAATSEKYAAMPDKDTVAAWAADSVAWCIQNDVMTGSEKDSQYYIEPTAETTRAQTCAFIVRADDSGLLKAEAE